MPVFEGVDSFDHFVVKMRVLLEVRGRRFPFIALRIVSKFLFVKLVEEESIVLYLLRFEVDCKHESFWPSEKRGQYPDY